MGAITTNNFRVPVNSEKTTETAAGTIMEFGLDAFAATLHESAIEKGFWEGEASFDKLGNKLALVHSEVTEVLEALRKDKGSHEIVEEISDVIIRLLDVYAAMRNAGIVEDSLDDVLDFKVNKNKNRPRLHGNLF
jgi:NTP pyrophosphatase (non-canonical NTP hydrolase)